MRGRTMIVVGLIAAVILLATGFMRLDQRLVVGKNAKKQLVYGVLEGRVVERGAQVLMRPMVEEKATGWGWTVEVLPKVDLAEVFGEKTWQGGVEKCEQECGVTVVEGGVMMVVVGRMAGEYAGDEALHWGRKTRV